MIIRIFELICSSFSIIGSHYVKYKDELGFVFYFIANILWIGYGVLTGQYFIALMNVAFIYYTITSIHQWRNGKEDLSDNVQKDL